MTFEKHICSVSKAVSQILGRLLLGRFSLGFVQPVEYCSALWCSAKLLDRVVNGSSFLLGLCLSVTLHIVDLCQHHVSCVKSGETRYILFMVLYLCRI